MLHAIVCPKQAEGLVADLFKAEQKLALDVQACESMRGARAGSRMDSRIDDTRKILCQLDPLLTRMDAGVAKLLQRLGAADQIELLKFISPIPFRDVLDTVKRQRTPGTGDWLLADESFQEWERIPSSSTLLFLQGKSGTGKTYLTSKVIDHVDKQLKNSQHHEGFAYFYCQKGPSFMDPCIILRSFVRQLSCVANDLENIQTEVVQQCDLARRNGASGLSYETCIDLILQSINLYPKTTIILDAFDESDSSTDNLVETLIQIMDTSTKPVKIFVSSRTGREVTKLIENKSTIIINVKNRVDIEKLLDAEVYSKDWFKDLPEDLQLETSETFTSRSQGVIRWVSLQVNRLKRHTAHGAIRDILRSLPRDLTESYDLSYKEIKERGGTDLALAERALKWVACTYQALEVDTLLEAVRLAPQGMDFSGVTRQKLLMLCEDFLTIDEQRQVWELSHTSVGEYFETKHWHVQTANLLVAQASLTLLIDTYTTVDLRTSLEAAGYDVSDDSDDDSELNYDVDPDHNSSEPDEQEDPLTLDPQKASDNIAMLALPLQVYTAHHWPMHVKRYEEGIRLSSEADAELSHLLKRFLGSPGDSSLRYRRWIDHILIRRRIYGGPSVPETCPFWTLRNHYLRPAKAALFAMCRFGFYHLLVDWWTGDSFNDAAKTRTEAGLNALALAVMAGAQPICERLTQSVDANFPLDDGEYGSVLIAAIAKDQLEIAKFLLKSAGARVDEPVGGEYGSALVAATVKAPLEFVQWLVEEAHASINLLLETRRYGSPLVAAAWSGRLDVVRYLVQAGAEVNAVPRGGYYGSALSAAVIGENVEVVRYLIEKGAEPDLLLPRGFGSALARAAFDGSIEMVEELIHAGANANLKEGWFGSALAAAAVTFRNRDEITEYLIRNGADVNQELEAGEYGSALVASICTQYDPSVAMVLLEAKATSTAVLKTGSYGSALAAAACWGRVDLLKHMVGLGTPNAALETLRQSRPPSPSALAKFYLDKVEPGRKQASRYLIEDLGLDAESLLRIGLDLPPGLSAGQITVQTTVSDLG